MSATWTERAFSGRRTERQCGNVRGVPGYSGYILEVFVTLAAVCGLAALVLWGGRRAGFGRPSGPVELRGHLQLDARRAIYLVKVVDLVYVIGVSEGGLTKVGEFPATLLQATPPPTTTSFSDVLARVLTRGGQR
jgi:flagellar biogenesis protein FliO